MRLQDFFLSFRRRLVDRDLRTSQRVFRGTVLDLGGGRTRGSFPSGKELGWIVLDEDIAMKPTVSGDAQKLPFRDASFDNIKCSELTGYLYEPMKMVTEIARVLKPGGYAVITSPYLTPFDIDQHDGTRLTSAWWKWAAEKSSLNIISMKSQGFFFTVLMDFEKYWITHWWFPVRYIAYIVLFPLCELFFWIEQRVKLPAYLKRFSTGFLVIMKKARK